MACCAVRKAFVPCARCARTTVRSERLAELADGTLGYLCTRCAVLVGAR